MIWQVIHISCFTRYESIKWKNRKVVRGVLQQLLFLADIEWTKEKIMFTFLFTNHHFRRNKGQYLTFLIYTVYRYISTVKYGEDSQRLKNWLNIKFLYFENWREIGIYYHQTNIIKFLNMRFPLVENILANMFDSSLHTHSDNIYLNH